MPVHDWTRVDAGIFHAFHLGWIAALSRVLNQNNMLPDDYYTLPEHHLGGSNSNTSSAAISRGTETDMEFYRRKQDSIVVRHVSGDRIVAMIEIVSPGDKSSRNAFRSFLEKVGELLDERIHLLIIDVLPPGPRDPHGIHAAIWDEIAGQEYTPPAGQPLTVAAYETALTVRAYVETLATGDLLPEMPLFLEPNRYVQAPLEATYQTAFAAMPRRWRRVLESTA